MNKTKGHHAENGLLLEGSYNINKTAVYGRYEWVQKSSEELYLDESQFGNEALFTVHALTAGASYDLVNTGKTKIALGAQLSVYKPDQRLRNLYGSAPHGRRSLFKNLSESKGKICRIFIYAVLK